MPDNINIDEGADRTVATDEIGGVNYQVVKLADGSDDGSDRISGDAANGLDVDVTRVADGADVALGATTDAKVDTDAQGTISAKLRGVVALLADLIQAEDSAHVNGDPGIQMLAVRDDDLSAFGGADGDYIPLTACPAGGLHVSGSFLGQSAATYDCPLVAIGGVVLDARPGADVIADNAEWGAFQMTQYGEIRVHDEDLNDVFSDAIEIQGDAAHDAAIAGNPVRLGGRAINSELTAVANGDAVDLVATLAGKLVNLPYANPEQQVSGTAGPITDTSTTQVIAAQGAGVKIYITEVLVTNGDDTTPTLVTIQDEDDNALWEGWAQDNGGGYSQTFRVPIPVPANKAIEAVCGTAGATVYVSINGYTGA